MSELKTEETKKACSGLNVDISIRPLGSEICKLTTNEPTGRIDVKLVWEAKLHEEISTEEAWGLLNKWGGNYTYKRDSQWMTSDILSSIVPGNGGGYIAFQGTLNLKDTNCIRRLADFLRDLSLTHNAEPISFDEWIDEKN